MTYALRSSRAFVVLVALLVPGAVAPALANHFILPCGDHCVAHWVAAAEMQGSRWGHTATLLPDGSVLVTGGYNGDPLETAELYDPATNTWRRAASLSVARGGHTATLHANGKVPVEGGGDIGTILSSAELYDPGTDTWTPAASMAVPRAGHTATLLANGKVLVAGGGNWGFRSERLNSTELYDPATDTWTPAASLALPRAGQIAVLMADGRVLVAGGTISTTAENSRVTEVYDPASNTWTSAGEILVGTLIPGNSSATALPEGEVLLAGGGDEMDAVLDDTFLYDPATNRWSPGGHLTTVRELHSATLLPGGKVLIVGGDNTSDVLASSELYDPANGVSNPGAELVVPRAGHTATLLSNGMVLVTGGKNFAGALALSSTELYITATEQSAGDAGSGN